MSHEPIGLVTDANTGRSHAQLAALVVGILFLVLGVLGFVPGITTNAGELSFAGHDARLFGLFQTSVVENLVHLVLGIAGVASARKTFLASAYLIVGGLFYLLFWLYALLADPGKSNDSLPTGAADYVLHIVLVVAMICLGIAFRPRRRGITPPQVHEAN